MVQNAVRELRSVSPQLTDDLDTAQLAAATRHIDALVQPLGQDDIRALIALLPKDGGPAAGLNWSILHAIEAAPAWPLWDVLVDRSNEWVQIFRLRLANAGIEPPAED